MIDDRFLRRCLLVGALLTTPLANGATVLSGATLFDGNGGPPIVNSVIRIANGRIQCVGTSTNCQPGKDDEVVDLSGQFITPGLIDAHVHFTQTGWLDGRPHQAFVQQHYDYEKLQASLKANQDRWHRAYLCSGITAVFDPGGMPWSPAFEQAAEGHPERVHYRAAGPLITHAKVTDLRALGGDTFLPMDSEEDVAEGVRRLLDWGARAVKVWYLNPPAERRQELDALLIKTGELARAHGLPLIVHSTELRNAKQALRAGAKMLVHSVEDTLVDAEFIELARQTKVIYAPTLQVGGNWSRALAMVALGQTITPDDPNGCIDVETRRVIGEAPTLHETAPAAIKSAGRVFDRLEATGQERGIMMANLKTLFDAGITVATATDAGNPLTFHGPAIYREMEIMQAAGIPAADIIGLSTRNGALVLDLLGDIGTLEKGKIADLIVLAEDPSQNASAFRSVHHVMHLGEYEPITKFADAAKVPWP
jgi:imidazolonepropionase-like amidohydrolase